MRAALAIIVVAVAALPAWVGAAGEEDSNFHCTKIAGLRFRSTEVISAAPTLPGDPQGSYCKAIGVIRPATPGGTPDIHFQVNMPAQWNEQAVQYGGGAPGAPASGLGPLLKEGYVTFGSDQAWQAATPSQAKDLRDSALVLIHARYQRGPQRTWFYDPTPGGLEGKAARERWPALYDGVLP